MESVVFGTSLRQRARLELRGYCDSVSRHPVAELD